MTSFLSDFLAGMGIGLGIILILALVLWGLSEWDRRRRCRRYWHWIRPSNPPLRYPTISRADLDVEAANCEAKYYDLPEHIRNGLRRPGYPLPSIPWKKPG